MTIQMNIAEAKAKLSQLIARAEEGEEVLVARDGKVVAEIRPRTPPASRKGIVIGTHAHLAPLGDPYLFLRPDPELEEAADGPIFPPE
ncbi:MAG TPA: type II toxin-antitoxin system prevent-host-death family antitoxin [Caulobacteraceae bacterium]